jgi:hypothetical protein
MSENLSSLGIDVKWLRQTDPVTYELFFVLFLLNQQSTDIGYQQ